LEGTKETILGAIHYTQHAAHTLGEKIGILEPTMETKSHEKIDTGAANAHNRIEREAEIGEISNDKAQYRHDVIDTGAERAHHAVDKAEDSSNTVKHNASYYAESVKESIIGGIHYTQHAAHTLGEKIGILEPTPETRMEEAKEKAGYYKEKVQETAENIKEKIEETSDYAKEKVQETAEDFKERLSEAEHFDEYMKAQDALYNTV